jgi:methionyl-tRNA formyltransferase
MLHEIVLLTGPTSQQLALTELLKAHNPELSFRYALTREDLLALAPATLRHSRLLAFTSGTIVPPQILHALGYGAYNFHPGPPHYPGWAPAHFALYEGGPTFGATAHVMSERVDAGPIIGVETFPIPDGIAVRELEQIAFIRLAYLFWRLSKDLATRSEPMPVLPLEWSGLKSTRQMYRAMCEIPADVSRAELDLRIRAFHDDFRGIFPTITLHGTRFQAVATTASSTMNAKQPLKADQSRSQAEVRTVNDAPSMAAG